MTEIITIVQDGNPGFADAIAVLDSFGPDEVPFYAPAPPMGEALEAGVESEARERVVAALTKAKYRIVEGGQL